MPRAQPPLEGLPRHATDIRAPGRQLASGLGDVFQVRAREGFLRSIIMGQQLLRVPVPEERDGDTESASAADGRQFAQRRGPDALLEPGCRENFHRIC